MRRSILSGAATAVWLYGAALNGATAIEANSQAVKAEATAEVLQAQGNPQAGEQKAYADDMEDTRNRHLVFAGLNLGAASGFGAIAVGSVVSRRRREQEPQRDTSEQ